ncbi:MAG: hypothetical protein H6Q89_4390, partial [Myxococcaceae bacterium]|nr:hypothetical protein [Myxococcaceae bacterium]
SASNTLTIRELETPNKYDSKKLVVFGAVATATGQRVFASASLDSGGYRLFSLDVLNDGTFAAPLPP